MSRLGGIFGGVLLALLVGGVFVTTQIADSDGNTLASRVPVVGSVLQGFGNGGVPGGPMIRDADPPIELLRAATCGAFLGSSQRDRRTVADAIIEVGSRSDVRYEKLDRDELVRVAVASCHAAGRAALVMTALTTPR